ncbi:endonuclease domain-containing protein [Sphingomonas oryzagri]
MEKALWARLRSRQIEGLKFRRQATIGPFVADFLCAEAMLVVELDGGQHNELRDRARTDFIEAQGYEVLRFWNSDVVENVEGVLTVIAEAAKRRRPSPNPLPQAGEG